MATNTAKVVLTLAIFVAVGVILLGPVSTTVNANTGTQSVTNETHPVQFDERIDLRGYDITPGSETVYGYNQTTGSYDVATASDYTLYEDTGELALNNTSLIDEGEDVKVSYEYQATGTLAATVIGFIPVGVALLIFIAVSRRVEGML